MKNATIVIADDDVDLVHALQKRCEGLGLQVRTAFDALDALNVIHETEPDLVCLDVNMPCGNGLSVLEMLTTDEHFKETPVIIMTGETNQDTVRRCHDRCAYYVEKCSDVWGRVAPIIRDLLDCSERRIQERETATPESSCSDSNAERNDESIVASAGQAALSPPLCETGANVVSLREPVEQTLPEHASETPGASNLVDMIFDMLGADPQFLKDDAKSETRTSERPWVLCIDDDADYSNALKLRLERYGVAVVRAFEGMEGIRFAFTKPADVILLDFEMPNGQGDYVLRRLKDNVITKNIPVIMITGRKDRMLQRQAISMGAVKFMNKPLEFEKLLTELRKHIEVMPAVRASQSTDDVPGSATVRTKGHVTC